MEPVRLIWVLAAAVATLLKVSSNRTVVIPEQSFTSTVCGAVWNSILLGAAAFTVAVSIPLVKPVLLAVAVTLPVAVPVT